MSQLVKQGYSAIKDVAHAAMEIAPGMKNLVQDVFSEVKHQGAMGAHELASALFSGNAFVMYSGGQPAMEHQLTPEHQQGQEHQREHAGMER